MRAVLEIPDPWRQSVDAGLDLIDYLERQIAELNRDLKAWGAGHPWVPLLLTMFGIGWVCTCEVAPPSTESACGRIRMRGPAAIP